jgi:hypothetical protein
MAKDYYLDPRTRNLISIDTEDNSILILPRITDIRVWTGSDVAGQEKLDVDGKVRTHNPGATEAAKKAMAKARAKALLSDGDDGPEEPTGGKRTYRKRTEITPEIENKIRHYANEGMNVVQITKQMGISATPVKRILGKI